MTDSVREQILAAAKTLLDGIAGWTFSRNRTARVVAYPSGVLVDGGQRADDQTLGLTRYSMDFTVEGYVQAATDDEIGPAVSAGIALIVAALMGDPQLGGLAVDLHEGETSVEFDRGEGKAPIGQFAIGFTVEFFTREADPLTAGP